MGNPKNERVPVGLTEFIRRIPVGQSQPALYFDPFKKFSYLRAEAQTASEANSWQIRTQKCTIVYKFDGDTPEADFGLLIWRDV